MSIRFEHVTSTVLVLPITNRSQLTGMVTQDLPLQRTPLGAFGKAFVKRDLLLYSSYLVLFHHFINGVKCRLPEVYDPLSLVIKEVFLRLNNLAFNK